MSRQLPQDHGDLEREQLLVQSGEQYEERKALVKLLRGDRQNEDAWLAYVATFSSFEGKLNALTTALKSLPHSFRLATGLRDLRQSVASDSMLNQDGSEDVSAKEQEILKAEKTQNPNSNSTRSSPSEVSQLAGQTGQRDRSVKPSFRVVKYRGPAATRYRVEGGEESWLTRRTFYDKWHAEVAIEVFISADTNDEAMFLKLIRNSSTKEEALAAAGLADAIRERVRQERRSSKESTEAAAKRPNLRAAIRKEPKNAELRFNLAIELLSRMRSFKNVYGPNFWSRIKTVQPNQTGSKFREALNELNISLALGFNDFLMSAKARFLVIVLSLDANDLRLVSLNPRHVYVQKEAVEAADKRLLPLRALADDIILDTARHLRRDPHDVEALVIRKAAFEFLGDRKGVGKTEQALREACSIHRAGLRTKTSEPNRSTPTRTRRKNDGLELEATAKQVLERLGMEARTTQVTGDGGIDIEAHDTRPIFAGKYIVQCKDWEQPVGDSVVRELFGVSMAAGANKGILISTGSFTKKAYEFAKGKPLELIDGEMLRGLISSLDTK